MAKSKKTSDAFDMAADIRKEVAAESVRCVQHLCAGDLLSRKGR